MNKHRSFYVTDAQLAAVLDWDLCLESARTVFDAQAHEQVLLTDPRVQRLNLDGQAYRVKGAAFPDLGIAGLRAGGGILFNEWPSMHPLGFVEERTNYAHRVGAVTAVALEPLGRERFETVCLFGAGRLARTTLRALAYRYELGEIRVLSRTVESREQLVADFAREWAGTERGIVPSASPIRAVADADLIVTITTAAEPLFPAEGVRSDAVVVSMGGGQELDFGLLDRSRAVLVDDLEGCLESGDLAEAVRVGRYDPNWVRGTLADLRQDPQLAKAGAGPLVLIPRGVAAMDIMQAYRALQVLGRLQVFAPEPPDTDTKEHEAQRQ